MENTERVSAKCCSMILSIAYSVASGLVVDEITLQSWSQQNRRLQLVHGSPTNRIRRAGANCNISIPNSPDIGGSNGWRCPSLRSSTCNVDDTNEIPSDRSNWAPYGSPVRHCIVEQVPEFCKLQFSFLIAGIVIAANFVKATCMTLLLSLPRYRRRTALVTLEDAISTFLERPDETTRGRCLQSALEIEHYFS